MKIVFLNPASDADPFYKKMVQFARLAARELGVELEVLEAERELERMRRLALGLLERSDRPDNLNLVNDRNVAAEVLPPITEAGLKVFMTCEGFFLAERQILGRPREKHPNWIGSLLPDDEQSGRLLAETLVEAARERGLVAADGCIHVVGLSGAYSTGAILRLNGLREVVNRYPDVVLDEVAPALWSYETAARLTPQVIDRNPDAALFWAANDDMALGAAEAIAATSKRPGADVVLGGVDWAPGALSKISEGVFSCSVGGHFLDCAWSVVLLHDYHHGHDFGASIARSRYVALTQANLERYALFFDEKRWPEIRFSRFSRANNPELGDFDFGVDTLLSPPGDARP